MTTLFKKLILVEMATISIVKSTDMEKLLPEKLMFLKRYVTK